MRKNYIVIHPQRIGNAWRAKGDTVSLSDDEAKYLLGNAIEEVKSSSTKPAKSKAGK